MTEDTKLAYSANHVYREGYEQGKADLIEEGYMSPADVNKAVARARYETLKDGYNQALKDLKFNLEEEKKVYAYNGYSLDTDKWLDSYLKSKLDL